MICILISKKNKEIITLSKIFAAPEPQMVLFPEAEVIACPDQVRVGLKPEAQLIANQFDLSGGARLDGDPLLGYR